MKKYNGKSIHQIYAELTTNDQVVQESFARLNQFQNKFIDGTRFSNFVMQGTLKKKVESVKFFQRKLFPKRYFEIHFPEAIIIIKHDSDTTDIKKIKQFPFRDVIELKEYSP